ncbi:MAG: phytochelatin synthase family protein [Bdellovibrionales bacterium]
MRLLCLCWLMMIVPAAAEIPKTSKAKYGPEAILLSKSHEYIQKSSAPDYWALSPYYTGQQTESACSLAALSMILNAARSNMDLKATDELVTQPQLLKRLGDPSYKKKVSTGGDGIDIDHMKTVLERSLRTYGIRDFSVRLVRTRHTSKTVQEQFHRDLSENEKSGRDFIVANFIQGILTGDELVGHYAPIGAYDAATKRVLILDPDRQWYEPYWVSEATLLKAAAIFGFRSKTKSSGPKSKSKEQRAKADG